MPNKNYIKGRRKEYKIVNEYKDKGFDIVQRTAGSHSVVDVIAINVKDKIIKLIQCKPNDFARSEELKILNDNKELNGLFVVKFVVI